MREEFCKRIEDESGRVGVGEDERESGSGRERCEKGEVGLRMSPRRLNGNDGRMSPRRVNSRRFAFASAENR